MADDTEMKLSNSLSSEHRLIARIAGPIETVSHTISDIKGIKSVINLGVKEEGTSDFSIETLNNVDIRKPLFNILADHKWPLMALDIGTMSLEDIFLKLTNDITNEQPSFENKQIKKEKAEKTELSQVEQSDEQPEKESE